MVPWKKKFLFQVIFATLAIQLNFYLGLTILLVDGLLNLFYKIQRLKR